MKKFKSKVIIVILFTLITTFSTNACIYATGVNTITLTSAIDMQYLKGKKSADLTEYNKVLAAVDEENFEANSWETYKWILSKNEMTSKNYQFRVDIAVDIIIAAQKNVLKVNLEVYNALLISKKIEIYTQKSWNTYQDVLNSNKVNQSSSAIEVTNATRNIREAQSNLVKKANLTEYNAVLTLAGTDYTKISWDAYQVVVNANIVTVESTTTEVTIAVQNIREAQNNLVKKANLTEYNAVLTLDGTDYTKISWDAYQVVVNANIVTVENTTAEVATAVQNIRNAQSNLIFAGQEDLDKAVECANPKVQGDYTSESWTVLEKALALPETTNALIVAKTIVINNAIKDIVFAGKINLDAAKLIANSKLQGDYTSASWTILAAAKALPETTNALMVEKTNVLNKAIVTLVFAGQANLNCAITNANYKKEINYTTASWTVLKVAILLPETTNTEVVTKTRTINNAVSGLVFAGKPELDKIMAIANSKIKSDYKIGSWLLLKVTKLLPETRNDLVVIKTKALKYAISQLVFVSQEDLNSTIANAKLKNQVDYTIESWTVLTNALALNPTTNALVLAKTIAINNAINDLVFAGQVDLDNALSNASLKVQADYTAASWTVLENAKALLATTNKLVVAKTTAIKNAMGALIFAGQEDLDKAVADANPKIQADYTAASWTVLENAKALLATTNKLVEEKTVAINNAIKNLVFAGQANLDNALNDANLKVQGDYTSTSWTVLENAKALLATTNKLVEEKTVAINNTIKNLVFVGQADLDKALNDANLKKQADYSITTWKVLADALLLPVTTNKLLEEKTLVINNALKNLEFAGQADLDAVKVTPNSKNKLDYTASSWTVLTNALVLPETTNALVVTKTTAINNALKNLVFVGKENLDIAKANAATKLQSSYIPTSWTVLTNALALPETTNALVVAKTIAINNAITELKLVPVKYKVIAYVGLNCRVLPNMFAIKIRAYTYGTILEITEIVNGWGRTQHGWVYMNYVTKVDSITPVVSKYQVTPYIGLNCRVSATIYSNKVTAYSYKTMLEISEILSGWGKTQRGWVCMQYLYKL